MLRLSTVSRVCHIFSIVCFAIQLNIVGETQSNHSNGENFNEIQLQRTSTVRWEPGSCSSLNSIEEEEDATYQYPALYTERCCLEPGDYTLVCHNNPPAQGWRDAYILIDGHRYCDDFFSYKSFLNISVAGRDFEYYFG